MNSQNRAGTAQILQFPPPGQRVRRGPISQVTSKQKTSMLEAKSYVGGEAWYHEAAILDGDRARKP